MIVRGVALFGLALMIFNAASTKKAEYKPSWTLTLQNPNLKEGAFSGTPQTNRSCGIARWDQTHLLIYFMSDSKNLIVRSLATSRAGGWSFSVLIVRTQDGGVEQFTAIPADGSQSELAVLDGGIVISGRDRLVFYSRTFIQESPAFIYSPLGSRLRNGEMGDYEHLYTFDDHKHFLLVDDNAHKSHFFLFDSTTFKPVRDWIVSGVDSTHLEIKSEKIIYGKLIFGDHQTRTTWWTPIDVGGEAPQVLSTPSNELICQFPIADHPDAVLDICGSISIVENGINTTAYKPHKNDIVGQLVQISPNGQFAAILRYDYKYGGVLDETEHWVNPGLLIVDLYASDHVNEISLDPMPRSQLTFNFASDSTLVVLSDGKVSAYKMSAS